MKARIVFFGTPDFAIPTLKKLYENDYEIVCVVTQPDKASGRGKKVSIGPVKSFALDNKLPLFQPESLKTQEVFEKLKSFDAQYFVVVAYGQIIPKTIINLPKKMTLNVHASLLPRHRGASPISHAILVGDRITGVSIMKMIFKLDAGDVVLQKTHQIDDDINTFELANKLSVMGGTALIEAIEKIENGQAIFTKQDESISTYASKIHPGDCQINWNCAVKNVHNFIRAYSLFPGAYTFDGGHRLKILQSKPVSINQAITQPGNVLINNKKLYVCTLDGYIEILKIQKEGKPIIDAASYINGLKQIPQKFDYVINQH